MQFALASVVSSASRALPIEELRTLTPKASPFFIENLVESQGCGRPLETR